MKLETLRIADLVSDPNNARKHDDKNLEAIKGSLTQFGQRKPIVVQGNVVIAGNGTLEAARQLGWDEIDIVQVPADWTKDQAKAFALADNRTAELATWDEQVLAAQVLELKEAGFEVADFGFETIEPEQPAGLEEDEIPEALPEANSKIGQIYKLGNHRLMCGDSSDINSINKLMNNNKANMVFTDPPYGMNLDTDYSKMGDGGKIHRAVMADNQQFNAKFLLDTFDYCKDIFLWGADYYVETLGRNYPNLGSWIIWDKYSDERIGLLDGRFGSTFETCWSKTQHKREIARVLVTTNYTARGDETRIHPTQKPVALAEWFFERWGKELDIVVDLFGGSGSTLMACEKTNRSCYMMELDPAYVDVIIKRWENLTGQKAELVS
jgi:site-specific DNA-methyltransferase (adenine-specific)